jgi:hypothetical protein
MHTENRELDDQNFLLYSSDRGIDFSSILHLDITKFTLSLDIGSM